MAAPQIRTYLLIVGRDANDKPYRAMSAYRVPIPGLTDSYESMSNTQLKTAKQFISAERALMERAETDIEHEALRRLEDLK